MSLLIINNLPETDEKANQAIAKLTETGVKTHIIQASELNISNCIGCKSCLVKTPGICCLKDDYKKIEELIMEYDDVVYISGTSLNFLDYSTMRLFERLFPFAVVFCEFREGSIRHVMRYDKKLRMGILYTGTVDNSMLNEWLDLCASHGNHISLGAFHISDAEELCKCIL